MNGVMEVSARPVMFGMIPDCYIQPSPLFQDQMGGGTLKPLNTLDLASICHNEAEVLGAIESGCGSCMQANFT
jgi:hypothetical protein